MTEAPDISAPGLAAGNRRLAILLAMAMFVLVVDTSVMNVSISAVVHDLHTTVSGVQSAIALEALVSAAFILIGSKVGDLIGRKRAYVLGLLGYGIGALAMALAQGLIAIIVFWAIVGGIGASLLLPAMQSLIHGNFEGAAQKVAPESAVAYVDNDPLVLVYARALLTSGPRGRCGYIDADLRDPAAILAQAARTLDFSQPVALMMLGIVGNVPDASRPESIIRQLMSPLPPGSYLALSDGVNTSATFTEAVRHYNENSASTYHPRSPEQLTAFFGGLDLVPPGVVELTHWRPEPGAISQTEVPGMGGVGRKP